MKRQIFLLFAFVGMLYSGMAFASVPETTINMSKEVRKPVKKDFPNKGERMPSLTVCTVNLQDGFIECNTQSDILSYELWDEVGETVVATYPTDHELTEFMSGKTGIYQLRLVTEEYLYIGYIELEL